MIGEKLFTPGARMLSKEEDSRRARLRQARVAQGYRSARAAAAALGLPESSFRSHENGQRALKEDAAMLYAERLSVRYEWLWSGLGEMLKGSTADVKTSPPVQPSNAILTTATPSHSRRLLPIRGRAQGGDDGVIVLDGTVIANVSGPAELDDAEGAYGVEIVGSSMEPRYEPGEIVWVDPRRAVHKNDYAVFQVRAENGELLAYVKRYLRSTKDEVVAWQWNPASEVKWDREDVEAIQLIVGSRRR